MNSKLKKYNDIMKHFQDAYEESKENQSIDYETNLTNHYDEDPEDWEGSLVFRHWNEDDDSDDYDGSLVFRHWNED
jgi:hypothetical protein